MGKMEEMGANNREPLDLRWADPTVVGCGSCTGFKHVENMAETVGSHRWMAEITLEEAIGRWRGWSNQGHRIWWIERWRLLYASYREAYVHEEWGPSDRMTGWWRLVWGKGDVRYRSHRIASQCKIASHRNATSHRGRQGRELNTYGCDMRYVICDHIASQNCIGGRQRGETLKPTWMWYAIAIRSHRNIAAAGDKERKEAAGLYCDMRYAIWSHRKEEKQG